MEPPQLKSFQTVQDRDNFIDDLQQLMDDAKSDCMKNTFVAIMRDDPVVHGMRANIYRSLNNDGKMMTAIVHTMSNLTNMLTQLTKCQKCEKAKDCERNICQQL